MVKPAQNIIKEPSTGRWNRWLALFDRPVSIAPLVTFRIVFGAVMVFSVLRFWSLGWIEDHFINTTLTFKYFGFHWVQLLPPIWMYVLHALMLLGAIGIMIGFLYRFSALLYFLTFTYTELIDLTYYLNHYYFVSIVSFLLILVPANRRFSIDCLLNPTIQTHQTPFWTVAIFKLQIAIVYIYAGLAKINYDWLIRAMPLKIWAPANDALPLIGWLFKLNITPYLFSWIGMIYDMTIVFWLSLRKTRWLAYVSVIIFHTLTGIMFQIGVFPIVMIGATWIFFSERFHERLLGWLENSFTKLRYNKTLQSTENQLPKSTSRWLAALLVLHFTFQILFPWRYLLYPGNLFWTEEGYRFSWRVMLMEKAGTATFYVKDSKTGREGVVDNAEFLHPHQEKQMAMQPDMILQFAQYLHQYYEAKGVYEPQVRVQAYVTLNAQSSRLLIDPNIDLTKITENWKPKDWIIHYNNEKN